MNIGLSIAAYSFVAGIAIFLGGVISRLLKFHNREIREEVVHWAVAFGGGVLLSAVAFALVPRALNELSLWIIVPIFLAGTLAFLVIDKQIAKRAGSFAQLMAMLMDFLPEALALGASFAYDPRFGLLLALFIGLQNLPEGFNAYKELIKKFSPNQTLGLMFALSLTGIVAALLGFLLLTDRPKMVAGIMLFAGGGLTYIMFQDIAPLSKFKGHWAPASGASFGFLVGIVGEKLLM